LGYLQKANGLWSDSSKESLDLLLNAHFPESQQSGHPSERGAGEEIELDPLLSDRNMIWSILSFKSYKSPGPDGITAAHIQQAGQIAINWLKKIFKSILAVGELPPAWQETKVVFIPKAGKSTHTTAKDFRPISPTSSLLMSFEGMISLHIRATTDPTHISEAQHAYTKGKSTESALHLVVSSIEKSLSIEEYTLIAFLDIDGTLYIVFLTAITEFLTELGVEPPMVMLIHKLLIGRMVTATLGTSTQTRQVNRGTPQGGVLSPLLWNIAVNKLLRILEGEGCTVVAYADDVAIIFNGKYPQTLCDLMTAKFKILSEWTIANGLKVNLSKTELVLFTKRYKIPELNPAILNNCNLSFSDHDRYLGLVLDKRLKWGLNNQEGTKKATIALYSYENAIGLR